MANNLEVVFDSGSSIYVITDDYAHDYTDYKQAAQDVKQILSGADTSDWDGNDEDVRARWDVWSSNPNHGCIIYDEAGLIAELSLGNATEFGTHSQNAFFEELMRLNGN